MFYNILRISIEKLAF